MKIVIALIFATTLYQITAIARRPAVLPVMGLSLDEYQHTPPDKSKQQGFNFTKTNLKKRTIQDTNKKVENPPVSRFHTQTHSEGSPALMLIFFALLPIIVWFTMMHQIGKKKKVTFEAPIDLDAVRAEKNTEKLSDDRDIPKAS
jgi:hypothetical protein